MSNQKENEGRGDGEGSPVSRRSVLQKGLLLAGGLAVAPTFGRVDGLLRVANSVQGKPGKPVRTPIALSKYQRFNPNVKPGGPTGLPKRVATNFPTGSAYFQQFADNVKLAVKSHGYEFTATTYGSDLAQNINQLDELINSGVGAVILQVQDEQGQAASVMKMIDKGICVVYSVAGPSTMQVIADQYQCGYIQGTYAAKWVNANLGGNAQVAVFNAGEIAPAFIARTQGRIDGIKTARGQVQIVANEPIKLLTPQEGQQIAGSVLQAHPQVDVWLGDDDTVIGVVAALEQAGKTAKDKILVSGFNAQDNALAAVKAGGLFRQDSGFPNGVYEYACGELTCDWIAGKSIPEIIDLGIIAVDQQDVEPFIVANNNPARSYHNKSVLSKFVTYYGNTSFHSPKYIEAAVTTGAK